jgi:hypothetical protein
MVGKMSAKIIGVNTGNEKCLLYRNSWSYKVEIFTAFFLSLNTCNFLLELVKYAMG